MGRVIVIKDWNERRSKPTNDSCCKETNAHECGCSQCKSVLQLFHKAENHRRRKQAR